MSITIKKAGLDEFFEGGGGKYRFLLFGSPGQGKTPWAAQFPDPIFLMADRSGPASLALTNTPYIDVRSEKDAKDALTWLESESRRPSFPYKTVVLDTFSVLQKHIIQGMLKRTGKKALSGFDDWSELGSACANVLHRLHSLDMHVVVNVHTKDVFDSEDGELEPDLQGAAKQDLPKEFENIGWIHTIWDVEKVDGVDKKVAKRVIDWESTPKMPLLRSTSHLLPSRTDVTFTPRDFEVLRESITANAPKVGAKAEETVVHTEDQDGAAAPDIKGGPLAVDATKVPAPKKKAPAKKKAEEPPQDAVANVQEALGGQVVSVEADIPAQIAAAKDENELLAIWKANKPVWTDELNELTKARKAELA